MAGMFDTVIQGMQLGQQNRLNRLASQAYSTPQDGQSELLGRMASISPQAAQAQQGQFQQDEDRTAQQLRGYVQYVNKARETGNQQAVNAALRAGGPLIQRITGRAPPTEWTPDMDAGWAELEARVAMSPGSGSGAVVHSQKIGEDGFIYNTMRDGSLVNTGVRADRQAWFRDHPGMAPEIVGKDGIVRTVGGEAPMQGQMPAAPGSAQAPVASGSQFVEESLALANQMIAAGIPEQQVDAFLQQRMNPPTGNQFQNTQPVVSGPTARARPSEAQTAAEVEAARQNVQMQYAPAMGAIDAQNAAMREGAVQQARTGMERQAALQERTREANDALDLLARAEELIPISTGSGLGALADRGMAFVGAADQGAQAIDSLKTIAGQLVARMPRMEGPQSDRDVQMYREMAGNLADPAIPRERRMAALRTVRQLQSKYADRQPQRAPQAPQAQPVRRARNPQTGEVLELRNGQWVPAR